MNSIHSKNETNDFLKIKNDLMFSSNKKRTNCEALYQIQYSILEFDKVINNILKYSYQMENINSTLNRIGDQIYNKSLSELKKSINKIFFKYKIIKVSRTKKTKNSFFIQSDELAHFFSNFIYDGNTSYCANITEVGYIILRLIGHNIFDINEIHLFLQHLFHYLISKGYFYEEGSVNRILVMDLSKNLYIFLASFFIKIDFQIINSYWDLKIANINNLPKIIKDLVDVIDFNMNLVKLIENTENNSIENTIEKWFLINKMNIFNKGFLFKVYSLNLLRYIKTFVTNNDFINIERILRMKLKKELYYIFTTKNKDMNSIISQDGFFLLFKDWLFNIFRYITSLKNEEIYTLMIPYKYLIDVFVVKSLESQNESIRIENKKNQNNNVNAFRSNNQPDPSSLVVVDSDNKNSLETEESQGFGNLEALFEKENTDQIFLKQNENNIDEP